MDRKHGPWVPGTNLRKRLVRYPVFSSFMVSIRIGIQEAKSKRIHADKGLDLEQPLRVTEKGLIFVVSDFNAVLKHPYICRYLQSMSERLPVGISSFIFVNFFLLDTDP